MIFFFFSFLIIVEKEERVGRKGVPRSNDSYDVRVISQSGLLRFLVSCRLARANVTRNIATRAKFRTNRRGRKSWVNSHARISAVYPVSTWPGWKLLESVISKVTRVSLLTSFPALNPQYWIILSKLVYVLDVRWRFGWITPARSSVYRIRDRFEMEGNRHLHQIRC